MKIWHVFVVSLIFLLVVPVTATNYTCYQPGMMDITATSVYSNWYANKSVDADLGTRWNSGTSGGELNWTNAGDMVFTAFKACDVGGGSNGPVYLANATNITAYQNFNTSCDVIWPLSVPVRSSGGYIRMHWFPSGSWASAQEVRFCVNEVSDEPIVVVPNFTISNITPDVNYSTIVTDTTTNGESFQWDFCVLSQDCTLSSYINGTYPETTTYMPAWYTPGVKPITLYVYGLDHYSYRITKYVYVGMSGLPNMTCTGLNCTAVGNYTPLIPTLNPTLIPLPEELNRTYYRDHINQSILGNFSMVYLVMIDRWGNGTYLVGENFINNVFMPITAITDLLYPLVTMWITLSTQFLLMGDTLLNVAVILSNALHYKIIALLTYRLLIECIMLIVGGVFK